MATILSLYRSDKQPPVTHTGNSIVASEVWCLTMSTRIRPIEADGALYALGTRNIYDFPAIQGMRHPDNEALLSIGYVTSRNDAAGYIFEVTVNYTNSSAVTAASKDPTDADPLYRSENVLVEREIEVDQITGLLIANSLSNLFLPKQVTTVTLKRWIITRNERTYDDIRSQKTVNKLNEDNLSINGRNYEPRSCLLESWEAVPNFDSEGKEYFVHTYKVLIDVEDLHQIQLVDVGVEKDLQGNPPPGRDPGKPITLPALLDGAGEYLPLAKQKNPGKEDIKILKFWVNKETPLSFLNFRSTPKIGTDLGRIPRFLGKRTVL